MIRTIRDPEKPNTLEELEVVTEKSVEVQELAQEEEYLVTIRFSPTVPHCSLATLIGEAACGRRGSAAGRALTLFVCRSLPAGEAAAVSALHAQGEPEPEPEPAGLRSNGRTASPPVCACVSSAGDLHL